MSTEVTVTYHAQEQFKRLSQQEQAELQHILSEPALLRRASKIVDSERFVSRFGKDKRVYWKQSDDGPIVVLSVIAHSSLAA